MARTNQAPSPKVLVVVALVFIAMATALLWWGESSRGKTASGIDKLEKITVDLPSIEKIDQSFNGKMVYLTGKARAKDSLLQDKQFNVEVKDALRLKRKVFYYQWVEDETEEKKDGKKTGRTEYYYTKKWVSHPVDSNNFVNKFGHNNTVKKHIDSATAYGNATVGAYKLDKFWIDKISNKKIIKTEKIGSQTISEIGDVKIEFEVIPESDISLIAEVQGDSLVESSNKYEKFGKEFGYLFSTGIVQKSQMFKTEKNTSPIIWLFRVAGFFFSLFGINVILDPTPQQNRKIFKKKETVLALAYTSIVIVLTWFLP